jgi:quercetin dioxygenase-like cupin family protein
MDDVAFTRIPADGGERFFAMRRELGVTTFGMNAITLLRGQRGRIHRHEQQEEVYLVLRGRLTLLIEGEEHELGELEAARVGAPVRRQLVNRHREPLLLLALGGARLHQGRDGVAFTDWSAEHGAPPPDVPLPDDVAVVD